MGWINRGAVCAIMLALALWGSGTSALAQPASDRIQTRTTPEEPVSESPDDGLEEEIQRAHRAFDILARSFSKKKRSELINLKSYTDAEWAQLEADVKADNAACRKGDAAACLAAGRAYENGDGVWIVPAIAFILYREACDGGLGEGCRAFVDLANSGFGYPEGGYSEVDGMNEKGCAGGDLVSCERFAEELRERGQPADIARADALREEACTAGSEGACIALAETLFATGSASDATRASGLLDTACLRGQALACRAMAAQLAKDQSADEGRIGHYRAAACDAGSAEDCDVMGARTWKGIGMAADRTLAADYYTRACTLREVPCELPRTLAAFAQVEQSCGAGEASACAALGMALTDPASPEHDFAKGKPLLKSACMGGAEQVCAMAASLYKRRDPATSRLLLEQGCSLGALDTCLAFARLLEDDPESGAIERAVALYARLCDARFGNTCEDEARFAGVVPSARIGTAGAQFAPPLPADGSGPVQAVTGPLEVCFSGSERFRGKTYVQFNCDRSEKGINSEAARYGQAPWQALLWRPERLAGMQLSASQRVLCGASLIAPGWVLTAAHCLTDQGKDLADPAASKDYRVRLGVFNSASDEGISYPILRVIRHPQFDPKNRYVFDIALVEYGTREARPGREGGFRNPIRAIALDPLPVGTRRIVQGTPVYAFGWGWTKVTDSEATDGLQVMKMDLASEASCTARTGFKQALSNAALCAIGKNREQACLGDSGGPLVLYDQAAARPVLVGVVSAGVKCGTTGEPSQYTRVAKVRDWIAAYVPAAVK